MPADKKEKKAPKEDKKADKKAGKEEKPKKDDKKADKKDDKKADKKDDKKADKKDDKKADKKDDKKDAKAEKPKKGDAVASVTEAVGAVSLSPLGSTMPPAGGVGKWVDCARRVACLFTSDMIPHPPPTSHLYQRRCVRSSRAPRPARKRPRPPASSVGGAAVRPRPRTPPRGRAARPVGG